MGERARVGYAPVGGMMERPEDYYAVMEPWVGLPLLRLVGFFCGLLAGAVIILVWLA